MMQVSGESESFVDELFDNCGVQALGELLKERFDRWNGLRTSRMKV